MRTPPLGTTAKPMHFRKKHWLLPHGKTFSCNKVEKVNYPTNTPEKSVNTISYSNCIYNISQEDINKYPFYLKYGIKKNYHQTLISPKPQVQWVRLFSGGMPVSDLWDAA